MIVLWMIRLPFLSKNKQTQASGGPCPGQGRRVCVSRKEKRWISDFT